MNSMVRQETSCCSGCNGQPSLVKHQVRFGLVYQASLISLLGDASAFKMLWYLVINVFRHYKVQHTHHVIRSRPVTTSTTGISLLDTVRTIWDEYVHHAAPHLRKHDATTSLEYAVGLSSATSSLLNGANVLCVSLGFQECNNAHLRNIDNTSWFEV